MPTPEERTAAYRAALAATPTFAIRFSSVDGQTSTAPGAFAGVWLHTSAVKEQILKGGWKPELIKNSMYGAAVYLSRVEWHTNTDVIRVRLNLDQSEVMESFKHAHGEGCSRNDLVRFLQEKNVINGYAAGLGSSPSNRSIRDYFLSKGIKAIRFFEHGTEVVAVYQPDCIEVLDEVE